MRLQEIAVYRHERTSIFTELDDRFGFRKDRPHKWLQRICLEILRRLGCNIIAETFAYKRHLIDGGTFMSRLLEQKIAVEDFTYIRPSEVLIGGEDYHEMMAEAAEDVFRFDSEYRLGSQVMGLKVTVVPWMRGVLVLPGKK